VIEENGLIIINNEDRWDILHYTEENCSSREIFILNHRAILVLELILVLVFTAQCTLVQMRGIGIACHPSVCLSVCDVGGL